MRSLTNPFIDVVVGCLSHCIPTLYHFSTFKAGFAEDIFIFAMENSLLENLSGYIYISVCVFLWEASQVQVDGAKVL